MVWKLLSALSAICLVVAAYFANASKNDITNELALEKRAKENLAQAKSSRQTGDERLETKKKQLVALNADFEKVEKDVMTAQEAVTHKQAVLELAKKNLEQVTQQLAAVETKIKEAGDIEKLLAQVASLTADKQAAELEVTNQTQALAATTARIKTLQDETERYRELEARQRRGQIEPDFEARVAQAFGEWGFAVLNKGNAGGVVANAELEVKRGKDVVARLKVKNVENAISVADIVPGSVAEGDAVRSGDLVVAAPVTDKPAAGAAPAAPAAPSADPAAAPLPTGDPVAVPPAAADPFSGGGMAPAAGTDPFSSPAPAPAPAAGADPFTTPATPPPAATGTKDSPSTADPFQ
jgi:hypothetical protein